MKALRQILAERRCLACSRPFVPAGNREFCPDCLKELPQRLGGFCPLCGEILGHREVFAGRFGEPGLLCPGCLEQTPPWGKIHFYGVYEGLLRALVLRLKFGGELHLARALAALLARCPGLAGGEAEYDLIAPVPLHSARLAERGFNQAGEMARCLGKFIGLPVEHTLARRAATRHQVGLSRRERVKNLRGAFSLAQGVEGKRILLVDDVMTTGATLAWASRSLLRGGAAAVDVAVPARTPARNMLNESRGL